MRGVYPGPFDGVAIDLARQIAAALVPCDRGAHDPVVRDELFELARRCDRMPTARPRNHVIVISSAKS